MKITNSRGPRTNPYGTSLSMCLPSKNWPFIRTLCFLIFSQFLIHFSNLPLISCAYKAVWSKETWQRRPEILNKLHQPGNQSQFSDYFEMTRIAYCLYFISSRFWRHGMHRWHTDLHFRCTVQEKRGCTSQRPSPLQNRRIRRTDDFHQSLPGQHEDVDDCATSVNEYCRYLQSIVIYAYKCGCRTWQRKKFNMNFHLKWSRSGIHSTWRWSDARGSADITLCYLAPMSGLRRLHSTLRPNLTTYTIFNIKHDSIVPNGVVAATTINNNNNTN